MPKRKDADTDADASDSGQDEHPAIVDINFDYYDVDATNDYHAVHRLLIQLFAHDAERVQTGPLAELVVNAAQESGVGSTIKTDDEDGSDAYAFLTVLSCHDPGLQRLNDYLLSKTSADEGFHNTLASLLQRHPEQHVGLVLGERLVNMPVQVMPPMYKMLSEEVAEVARDDHAYRFTHYLFISRVYRLSRDEEEAMLAVERHAKRQRLVPPREGVYGFHPEDEEIMQHAVHTATYAYTDAVEGTGVEVAGRAMLVRAEKLGALVGQIAETYAV